MLNRNTPPKFMRFFYFRLVGTAEIQFSASGIIVRRNPKAHSSRIFGSRSRPHVKCDSPSNTSSGCGSLNSRSFGSFSGASLPNTSCGLNPASHTMKGASYSPFRREPINVTQSAEYRQRPHSAPGACECLRCPAPNSKKRLPRTNTTADGGQAAYHPTRFRHFGSAPIRPRVKKNTSPKSARGTRVQMAR